MENPQKLPEPAQGKSLEKSKLVKPVFFVFALLMFGYLCSLLFQVHDLKGHIVILQEEAQEQEQATEDVRDSVRNVAQNVAEIYSAYEPTIAKMEIYRQEQEKPAIVYANGISRYTSIEDLNIRASYSERVNYCEKMGGTLDEYNNCTPPDCEGTVFSGICLIPPLTIRTPHDSTDLCWGSEIVLEWGGPVDIETAMLSIQDPERDLPWYSIGKYPFMYNGFSGNLPRMPIYIL